MTAQLERAVSLRVESEVGTLRKVIVHRPGLEHTRLTPIQRRGAAVRRCDLGQAGQGGARRVRLGDARPRRGGLVRRAAADRCARACQRPASGSSTGCSTSATSASTSPDHGHEWGRTASPRRWRSCLIGGITKRDLAEGEGLDVRVKRPERHAAAAAAELPLSARPVVLDLRRGDAEPDGQARAPAGDRVHGGDLPLAPDVRPGRRASRSGTAGSSRTGAARPSRAATSCRSATAR